jgi:16S rRNA (adenine1518-N6/adenine1519-N6)-dimethyltransferase
VQSAVVQLKMKELDISDNEREVFINVVKAAFGNRRKTLKNSLSNSIFKELNFSQSGIDLSLRAEQLELQDFAILSAFVKNNIE